MGNPKFLRWLLPGLLSVAVYTSSAEAAQLRFWRFEANQNQLSFTTQGGVQPQAQLLSNPSRLVIDLPGTTLGQVSRQQSVGGAIREIRIGQFNAGTARIVVELADGYTLDPQQVKFRGISANEWTVQLPTPQLVSGNYRTTTPVAPAPPRSSSPTPSRRNTTARTVPTQAATIVETVEIRDEGIVLYTSGQVPQIEFKQSQDGNWMTLDIFGATLSPESQRVGQRASRSGAAISRVSQFSDSPPIVRIAMTTPNPQQNWEARASAGGIAVWPQGKTPPAIQTSSAFATVQSVELQNQNYFTIKADEPLNYTHGWDQATGAYSITFFSAELGQEVQLPQREVGGPLVWTKVRQDDPETFTLLFKPATRVQVGQPSQPSANEIVIPIGFNLASIPPVPPTTINPGTGRSTASSPRTLEPLLPPRSQNRQSSARRPLSWPLPPLGSSRPAPPPIRNGRVAVMIDPGHGGSDVGAVGLGGIREIDIVMPISQQVAQILEQNGVQAIMTRTDNRTVELEPRVNMANRVGADLFVSIHANAASRRGASGIETFYYQTGYTLAQYIQRSILANFRMENRGVKQARFYVLRNTAMPSALVEVGFVTNDYDAAILANPANRSRMAQAIAEGILQYLRASGY
ncbi:MAG: N-acetylmuramoyl-L-alanine amidase [Microcoleaceae cyanobacterium]